MEKLVCREFRSGRRFAGSLPHNKDLIVIKPFTNPSPSRIVAIAWRKHFPRKEAIHLIHETIQKTPLYGVEVIRQIL